MWLGIARWYDAHGISCAYIGNAMFRNHNNNNGAATFRSSAFLVDHISSATIFSFFPLLSSLSLAIQST